MDISLLHAGLAAGAALAAIPVLIHLVMRQTPKHVIFPALRLIRQRHQRSTKRLRVRNWLLLLARMALVALMALALARPALNSQASLGDTEIPTALGLVFDTSLSMGYTDRGRTRLEEAKARAREILARLHERSQVFVVDSAEPGVPVPVSPAAARKRVDALVLRAANRPLNAAVGQAYAAVAESDRDRHEVYVLTDLARSAWDLNRPAEGLDKAKTVKLGLATYVLRLAPQDLRNVAVVTADVQPAAAGGQAAEGELLEVRGRLRSAGPATSRLVEFYLDGTKRGQATVALPADGEAEVSFKTPPNLATGLHQAELRGAGTDPLAFDDRHYLSFIVRPPLKVLIVYDPAADAERRSIDAYFVANALDPYGFGRPYQVEVLPSTRLAAGFPTPLKDYACVVANNVRRLPDACWDQLNTYIREGGGLVVGLGHRVDRESYNGPLAQRLLPAAVGEVASPPGGTSFGQADFTHPLFHRAPKDLAADLSAVPVWRYAAATKTPQARPLLAFQDGAPALLERDIAGTALGRVLLWTTSLSYRPTPSDRDPAAWNAFPLYWSFLEIVRQTVPFVAGTAGERLNFEAGEDVFLPIEPGETYSTYIVQGPDSKTSSRLTPSAQETTLAIEAPPSPGHWTVTASGPGGRSQRLGFSVNPRADESQLSPLEPRDLDALFGKDRYKLADDPESLKTAISTTRIGHEIFPWMMALILVLLTVENLLANRFHREKSH